MGTIAEMRARVQEKLSQGFTVLKFKIGAMDFDQEFTLLSEVRNSFGTSIECTLMDFSFFKTS